jgi:hypothetical protein
MSRTIALLASIATTALTLLVSAAPAYAADSGYRLTAASAAKSSTIVARDVLWRCGPEACTAASATSRPAIVCSSAARELGKLTSFSAKGAAFSDAELAKCNEKAR